MFALDEGVVYSAMRLSKRDPNKFVAYYDHNRRPAAVDPIKRGDTKHRLLVIGYSNNARIQKAEIEKALFKLGDCVVYEGCRSSTMDIINIFRNQYDAYIDARAVFGKDTQACLWAYDVASILPTAYAHSFSISDIYGRGLEDYDWEDPLPLVVARPGVYDRIMSALENLSKQNKGVPTCEEWWDTLEKNRSERKNKQKKGDKQKGKDLKEKRVPIKIRAIPSEEKTKTDRKHKNISNKRTN